MWKSQIVEKKFIGSQIHITVDFKSGEREHTEIFNLSPEEVESLKDKIEATIASLEKADEVFAGIKVVPRKDK